MLTMTQAYHIKYSAFHKGKSYSEISRETGHDFKTVKKYAEKEDWTEKRPKKRKSKKSKLDPYKPIIDEWLQADLQAPLKQRHTAKRVYDRLKEKFGNEFDVSDRTVRYYVSGKKKELFNRERAYLPLEHPPGEAQADFGESVIHENGRELKVYSFVLSFPQSNVAYEQAFKGQNQECFLEGMKRIFEHIGGVPTKIWFDNLSAAVKEIQKKGGRSLIDQFEQFALHYGFLHNFCNPGKSHEKGHVENKVGYTRRNNFVPVPRVASIEELNKELFKRAEKDADRPHYLKNKKQSELFKKDRASLLKLPDKPFKVGRLVKAKPNKWGKVKFDNKTYSTSPEQVEKEVWLHVTHDSVEVLDENYDSIVTHPRLYERQESMNWFPYLELIAKRPNALKYTGFYRELPDTWRDYLEQLEYTEKKKAIRLLKDILENSDLETAIHVLSETLKSGVEDTDSIRITWIRETSNTPLPSDLELEDKVQLLAGYTTNLGAYDELLEGSDKK